MTARPALILAVALAATALSASAAAARPAGPKPNTAKPGSPCKPEAFKGPYVGPGAGLDTSSLGRPAPAPYEIGAPSSTSEPREPARRVMMLVHGGAWLTTGRQAMRTERSVATRWRAAGWETISVSYRACRRSVGDVLRFYDLIRARVGPEVPICLRGQSAGGHLALLVAAKRPSVACVISLASPTDLRSVRAQGRIESVNGAGPAKLRQGAARVANLGISAFGRRNQRARSPVTFSRRIRARLLLATGVNDVVIPQGQAAALANAVTSAHPDAYVDLIRLAAGSTAFVHGSVSAAAAHRFDARTAALVAPFGNAPTDAGPPLNPPARGPLDTLLDTIGGLLNPPG